MATRKQLEKQYIEDQAFWGSIRGRWRGLAGGMIAGAVMGAVLGLIVTTGFGAVSGIAIEEMGRTTLMGMVGMFTGAGMMVAAGLWAAAGTVAGAVSSGLMAQKELEQGKSKTLEMEVAPLIETTQEPKQPLFNAKVTAMGALATGAIGAFLAYNNVLPSGASYAMLGQQGGTAIAAAASAITFSTFGAVFGMAFKPWQAMKEYADGLFEGRLNGRSMNSMEHVREQLLQPTIDITEQRQFNDGKYVQLIQQQRQQPQIEEVMSI